MTNTTIFTRREGEVVNAVRSVGLAWLVLVGHLVVKIIGIDKPIYQTDTKEIRIVQRKTHAFFSYKH